MTMRTTGLKRPKSDDELSELLELIDPEDFLVWLGVDYQITRGRSGTQLNIRECPRCGGSERKVYINAETGLGNCFHGACVDHPGYNLFSFTKAYCGDDARDAIGRLKTYAATVGWKPRKKERPAPLVATGGVTLPKSHALPINGRNLTYLQARGIDTEIVAQLGWRYCKEGCFEYLDPDGEQRFQDYSQRVIIPVFDVEGVVRTFQGRDITGTKDRRYLFPPGLAGTGQFLYNAHNAIGAETIVICEGAFDVAATMMALKNDHTQSYGVVGTFGKRVSMSAEGSDDQLSQLYLLRAAGAKKFIFLWDGEASTVEDACSEAFQLLRYGFTTEVALLPLDKDPNEVPAQVVRGVIRDAIPITPMAAAAIRLSYSTRRA